MRASRIGGVLRALACVLALSMLVARSVRAEHVEGPDDVERVLFFVPTELRGPDRRALADALAAQFSLGTIEVVLADDDAPETALGAHIAAMSARASEAGAFAVCWIDAEPDGRWLVHVLDPVNDRLVVRPIDAAEERRGAAIEAVAVMTRDSAEAIASGVVVPTPAPSRAPSPAPRPQATPTSPTPAPRPLHRPVRLSVGYAGHDFAPEVSWRHGALVSASWVTERGPLLGASWAPSQDVQIDSPVRFEVERPLVLAFFGGYRWTASRVALDGIVGLTVDAMSRHTPAQPGVRVAGSSSRLATALSPRVQVEWAATAALGIYANGGIDIVLNNFKYFYDDTDPRVVLDPHRLRLVVSAGVAVYP